MLSFRASQHKYIFLQKCYAIKFRNIKFMCHHKMKHPLERQASWWIINTTKFLSFECNNHVGAHFLDARSKMQHSMLIAIYHAARGEFDEKLISTYFLWTRTPTRVILHIWWFCRQYCWWLHHLHEVLSNECLWTVQNWAVIADIPIKVPILWRNKSDNFKHPSGNFPCKTDVKIPKTHKTAVSASNLLHSKNIQRTVI